MPKRFYGLIGYIGERIVRQYLEQKYDSEHFHIVEQVIPLNANRRGGGYLDFGVLRNNNLDWVYEVKCQDYILDENFKLNPAIEYLWNKQNQSVDFITQDGEQYLTSNFQQAYIIALVGPNKDFIEKHGIHNCSNIILFSEILTEGLPVKDRILAEMGTDLDFALEIIKHPTQGKRINAVFIKDRTEHLHP